MELQPIKDNKHLMRDLETGAILNINKETPKGLKLAKENKRLEKEQLQNNTTDINSLKSEISEIKTMLKVLIEGRNNGR